MRLNIRYINSFGIKAVMMLAFLGMGMGVWGQVAAWDFQGIAGNEASVNANSFSSDLLTPVVTRGAGLNAATLSNAFNSSNYTVGGNKADAITNNNFVQFTIAAGPGQQVSLSTLDARFRRSSAGPNTFQWQYSLDGFATAGTDVGAQISYTSTTTGGDNQAQINLSAIGDLQNVASGTTITFRLLGWGATNTGGTFALGRDASGNDLTIGGTTSPLACSAPDPVTNFIVGTNNTVLNLSWINGACFDEILVVGREGSAVTFTPSGNGSSITANSSFGTPASEVTANEFAVFKGTGTNVDVTNLTNGLTYHFAVFARLGTSWTTAVTGNGTPELSGYFWNGGDNTASPAAGGNGSWLGANNWREPNATGSQATWANGNRAIFNNPAEVELTGNVTTSESLIQNNNVTFRTTTSTSRTHVGNINLEGSSTLQFDINSGGTGNGVIRQEGSINASGTSEIIINKSQDNADNVRLEVSGISEINVPVRLRGQGTGNVGLSTYGTLTLNNNIVLDALLGTDNFSLGGTSGNTLNINGVISGNGNLRFANGGSGGAAVINLNAVATHTGNTQMRATLTAIVNAGQANVLPSTSEFILGDGTNLGTFNLNGFNQELAGISSTASNVCRGIVNDGALAILTLSGSGTYVLNENTGIGVPATTTNITGTANNDIAIVKTGSGTQEFQGELTYTGLTTVSGGTLILSRTGGNTIPATNNIVVDGGTLVIRTSQELNDLTINSGSVVVEAGATLTINGNLVNSGTITLQASSKTNYARLITNAASGSGTISQQMRLTPGTSFKWYAMGAPTAGVTVQSIGGGLFTNTSVYSWHAVNGWAAAHTATFERGKGLLIAAGENSPHGSFTITQNDENITFTGANPDNSSDISVTMDYGNAPVGVNFTDNNINQGWNLLANPYHADFDLVNLVSDNQSGEKALYIRTPSGYQSYVPGPSNTDPLYLSPGEGFFVRATNTGQNFTFARSRRAVAGGDGLLRPTMLVDKVEVEVRKDSNTADVAYINFLDGATTNFDGMYDAHKLNNDDDYPTFYTEIGAYTYAINALPLLTGSYSLPAGFKTTTAGNYSISLANLQDMNPLIQVTLEDKRENTFTDLRIDDYTFNHLPNNAADRFILHFDYNAVRVQDFTSLQRLRAWVYENDAYVHAANDLGQMNVAVIDITGKVLYQTNVFINKGETQIALPTTLRKGVYMLKLSSSTENKIVKFSF